jgi:PAS domain S-box-containing protein
MRSVTYSSNWIAVTLSSNAVITSLSPSAEQFIGYAPNELVGCPITQILADRTTFELQRILNLAKDWGHWTGEIVHRTRSGKSVEARAALSLLTGRENSSSGFLLISNLDMSKPAEGSKSDLEDVGAKLRMFAHELNNPLAVVMGFTQLLTLDTGCQGKTRKDIEKLYAELKQVAQVVEKLHTYAIALHGKPQSDRKQPEDLQANAG